MSWREQLAAMAGRVAGTDGAILCFHGIDTDRVQSASSMHVRIEQFEAMLEQVRPLATFVPLRELLGRHLSGRSTAGMVALTADDAYASWLEAEPVLGRGRIPLTLFAVSSALSTGQTFWWDRIEDAGALARADRWARFEDACGLPESYRTGHPASEGRTRPLRQWTLAEQGGRWPEALEPVLAELESDLGAGTSQRSMTVAELAGFLERTGSEVGVHTRSHAALPFLPDTEVIREISEGYEELRHHFPGALACLAIPFGLYDARVLRLAAEAGMASSLTLAGTPLGPALPDRGVPRLCVVREHAPGVLAFKVSSAGRLVGRLRGERSEVYPVLPSATT
jgi:peptidoglycan/xylan/chitin deacetylase (PgdA/CDA1 family)